MGCVGINHFEVFSLNDAEKWRSQLELFPTELVDIYFYPEYYQSWQSVYGGEALCVYAEIDSVKVLYPFVKREIEGYKLEGCFYDISSIYGYGGAISTVINVEENIKKTFSSLISDWCENENIVAEFIREYPGATVRYIDKTNRIWVRTNVYVDTTLNEESIWQNLSKRVRRDVRYALKKDLKIEVDEDLRTIDDLYNLYCETAMDRNFDAFYHFPKNYFIDLKTYIGNDSVIINAIENSKIIASVLCFYSDDKFTHHLGCSLSNKLSLCPNDLLYWEMIKQAIDRNCRHLNFGGGMSTLPEDNLFLYKKKFGNHEIPIFIETCVHNKSVYEEVCRQWELRYPHHLNSKGHYFLRYREVN